MTSRSRPPSASAPHLPPTTSPLTSATGSALDVIVVVPSSNQSKSSTARRRASSHNSDTDSAEQEPTRKGVVASSDFFVTFPSGLAWVANNTNNSTSIPDSSSSIHGKSITKPSSSNIRSYLYSRSKSFLSDIRSNSTIHGGRKSRSNSNGTINNEIDEKEEEGIEVGDGSCNALETTSERGTACTEPHHLEILQPPVRKPPLQHDNSGMTQMQQSMPSHSMKRKGNVQVRINGRYIPQLDMIFTPKRSNALASSFLLGSTTTAGAGGGIYGDDEPTSCRFLTGNGLRPSIETLEMLLMEQDVGTSDYFGEHSIDEHNCTCHDSIKRSEFHLCATTNPTQQGNQKDQQSRSGTTTSRGAVLTHGRNLIRYNLFSQQGTIAATAEAHLYLWNSSDSIIVSDIDGTITKSDIRGVIDTLIQDKYEHVHEDICKFFHSILDVGRAGREEDCNADVEEEEGCFVTGGSTSKLQSNTNPKSMDRNRAGEVRFLYLSARPVSLIGQTRKFLQTVSQSCATKQIHNLPPGPIMCHRSALSSVLYSELVAKNIHEFKADVLARQVVIPFVAARGGDDVNCKPTPYLRKSSDNEEPATCRIDGNENECSTEGVKDNDNKPSMFLRRRSSSGKSSMVRSFSEISEFSSTAWDNRLFLAGFGNKMTDAVAYEMGGIDRGDIYIINTESRILCMGVNEVVIADERHHDECIDEPADLSSSMNKDCCMDPSEFSFVEVLCCPGGIDNQILAEETAPVHQSDHATEPPTTASKVSVINSTDVTPTDDDRRQHEYLNVTVTTEKDGRETSTSSSSDRARRRPSIKAFTSKIPINKFPSFGMASSMAKKPSSHMFEGYGDPMLLERIRRRAAELEQTS